jgi:hypothetical protein
MSHVRDTLRNPAVWLGVLGTALVGLGSTSDDYSTAALGWPNPVVKAVGAFVPPPLDGIAIVTGAVLLTWAWWHLRPLPGRTQGHAGLTLTLWAIPLLGVPPVLSNDAALYADLGWIQLQGLNPYQTGLTGAFGPFAGQVDPLWSNYGVAYPPLALLIHAGLVALAGADGYLSVIAMRLPVLASVAVIGVLLPRIADRMGVHRRGALWLGLLNPLLVLHLIGGGHNDAPMIALSLLAVALVLRFPNAWVSLLAAPVVVGVAMALKQQGGLTVIAVAGLPVVVRLAKLPLPGRLWLLGWRSAVAAVVAVATFAAICVATGLGFGWINWLDLMGRANTPAPLAMTAKLIALGIEAGGTDPTGFLLLAGTVSSGILLVVIGWILVRFSDRPLSAVAWGSLAIAVLGQALHPWYLAWSLALLAVVPLSRSQRRWVYGLSIGFTLWNAVQTVLWHGQHWTPGG